MTTPSIERANTTMIPALQHDSTFREAAHRLRDEGFHPFPLDHPDHPKCIGLHGPKNPCDGQRGKHPAVKFGTWAVTVPHKMIDLEFDKYKGICNIGIACGPSQLVVLDEDEFGELERWCKATEITLPPTYTVKTGRGYHYYFRWDHSVQRIGNGDKAFNGYKIDVRGDGGYAVAEGSQHESGAIYTGNGFPIAPLPVQVAAILLAGTPKANGTNGSGDGASFFEEKHDPNTTKIPFTKRHNSLVSYAGRLRNKGMDRQEAGLLYRQRWLLCEQPTGQYPEHPFHSDGCPHPVTWEEAEQKLDDVYDRYEPGKPEAVGNSHSTNGTSKAERPRLWDAAELRQAEQPKWLAKNRIPQAAVTILIGEEGIGKSLLWVLIAASITTGTPMQCFGIPQREPGDLILILTEDEWSSAVLPRLQVAGADLDRVKVICTEDDGSGSPVFPDDMGLILNADPAPALVVCDAWLDTVPVTIRVGDAQQSRQALHPWKEAAGSTGASMMLLTHSNRLPTANIRDRYGASASLRQKARMTLYCLAGDGGVFLVGPDKSNGAPGRTHASKFRIKGVPHFEPSLDHDGTVPLLEFIGESNKTIREHLAEAVQAERNTCKPPAPAVPWLREFLTPGQRTAKTDIEEAGEQQGFSKDQIKRAKAFINKGGEASITAEKDRTDGKWYWTLQQTDFDDGQDELELDLSGTENEGGAQ